MPFLSEMILWEMLWIYADYFIPLLAVSTGFVYVSVCRVHKTWTTWKDTQIDLKAFDLLSEF